ncbi:hypothetical protein CVT24_012654 [Panaeolus cyanescens]|uniref:Uncharacterized protein n=1 Tax=Panaeolus cyanescens TaxID=181874 RepID=A0A409WWW9_9AGAR|nr:hypothetical protein CVT24_012654 [Panaeolus cyanescens]
MDEYYDYDAARNALLQWTNQRKIYLDTLKKKTGTLIIDSKVQDYIVATYDNSRSWRLCHRTQNNTEAEFRVQGIIGQHLLPPVTRNYTNADHKAKERARGTLRQSVTLTGLGLPAFDNVIIAIEKFHVLFNKSIPQDLCPWQASESQSYISFDCSSKYFTRSAPGLDIQQMPQSVDPEGNLTALINHQWVHTSDNIVVYKQLQKNSQAGDDNASTDASYSMNAASPSIFRIGDIVEASITFSAFRLQNKKVCMFPILRGLLHLDGAQSEAALINRMRSSYSVVQRIHDIPRLKRKDPFEEDHENTSRIRTPDDEHEPTEEHRAIHTPPRSATPSTSPAAYTTRPAHNPNIFSAVPAAHAPRFASQPATTSSSLNNLHAMQGIIRIENATFTMLDTNHHPPQGHTNDSNTPPPSTTTPLNSDVVQRLDTILQDVNNLKDTSTVRFQALQEATNAMRDHAAFERFTTDVLTTIQSQQSACYRIINTLIHEMNWMTYQFNRFSNTHYAHSYAHSSSSFSFPGNSEQGSEYEGAFSPSSSSAFTDGELLQLSNMKFDDNGYLVNYRNGPADDDGAA